MVAREAFGNATATWPSPEDPAAFYKIVGERIQKNLTEMFTFLNWFVALNESNPIQAVFSGSSIKSLWAGPRWNHANIVFLTLQAMFSTSFATTT